MNNKSNIITALTVSLLLMAQTAHADFRKALEAYQKRDGTTMLKEVKDAVDKKNNDGLMLLLMATNMDAATSDYDETTKQSKSTLRAILPQPNWVEMRELLVQATNNSTVDAQYYFLTTSQFGTGSKKEITDEYASKGSRAAMLSSDSLTVRAEADDVVAQLQLGFRYLNYENEYGCQKQSKDPICQTKNEAKGYYWLDRAIKSGETLQGNKVSERVSITNAEFVASAIQSYLYRTANGNTKQLKQAYLWAALQDALLSNDVLKSNSIATMHNKGELAVVDPKLESVWGNRELMVKHIRSLEPPEWLLKARNEFAKAEIPVFSIYLIDEFNVNHSWRKASFLLHVYSDGNVEISQPRLGFNALLQKVPPKTLRQFISELEKEKVYQWPRYKAIGECDTYCPIDELEMVARNNAKVHHVYYVNAYGEATASARLQRIRKKEPVFNSELSRVAYNADIATAKLRTLIEKYFPTRTLRCELGNSKELRETCMARNLIWENIAKEVK